jgi:hypothetical protein
MNNRKTGRSSTGERQGGVKGPRTSAVEISTLASIETFASEVVSADGATLPLNLEVNQATGDARLSIGEQTCIAIQAGQYDEHGSIGGLTALVNVIADQIHVYFTINSERLTVVAVSGGYGRQEEYSISADEGGRLRTWIGGLRPSN